MEEYEDQEADRAHTAAVRQRVGLLLAFYFMKTMQHDMDDASTFSASRTLTASLPAVTHERSLSHATAAHSKGSRLERVQAA